MIKLGEGLTIKHGWAFKGEFFSESGEQSILTPGNFYEAGGFKYNDERERYYTGEYPSEYLCKKGDLIVAMTEQAAGLLGSTAIVPKDNRYLHNQRIGLVTCDEKQITKMFAYYLFMSKSVREQISRTSSGTKVKHTSPEKIYDVEVSLPNIPTQKKIAHLLWNIDSKIRNNTQINDNLQQMSTATYMHLFYGKKGNGKLGDILIENPKSTIQVSEAKNKSGDFPFFTSGNTVLKWTEPIVDGRNILLNTGGNAGVKFYVGKIAYSTDTWCITAKEGMEDYLYLLLNSIKRELNLKFFQGTGLKHLQKPLLKDRAIYIPSKDEISAFNADVQPWFSMISDNTRESFRLSALRDWLLPMLMNGQVSFKEEQEEKPQITISGFEKWIANQGFAARGNLDMDVLKDVYGGFDDVDK